MSIPPVPDGFRNAADKFRVMAEAETDSSAKQTLLESAGRFDEIDAKARKVFEDIEETKARVKKFQSDNSDVRHSSHKSWKFWAFILGVALIVYLKHRIQG